VRSVSKRVTIPGLTLGDWLLQKRWFVRAAVVLFWSTPFTCPAGVPAEKGYAVRVNCGSAADEDGCLADRPYARGGWGYVERTAPTRAYRIDQIVEPHFGFLAALRSDRHATDKSHGTFAYRFDCPNGTYTVRLYFAELYHNAPRLRSQQVAINGTVVLKDFDIYAAADGRSKGVMKEFAGHVVDQGSLEITFTSRQGQAQVNVIEVLQEGFATCAPAPAPMPPSTAPPTPASPVVYATPVPGSYVKKVDCGSLYDDADWGLEHDRPYTPGSWGSVGAAYQVSSCRDFSRFKYEKAYTRGMRTKAAGSRFSYKFTAPNGTYSVKLYLCEDTHHDIGLRRMNVDCQGVRRISDLDLFREARGRNRLLVRTLDGIAVTDGLLDVTFSNEGIVHVLEVWQNGVQEPAPTEGCEVIVNQVGYVAGYPKTFLVQSHEDREAAGTFTLVRADTGAVATSGGLSKVPGPPGWDPKTYYRGDFSSANERGRYFVKARLGDATVYSYPFKIGSAGYVYEKVLTSMLDYLNLRRQIYDDEIGYDLMNLNVASRCTDAGHTWNGRGGWYDAYDVPNVWMSYYGNDDRTMISCANVAYYLLAMYEINPRYFDQFDYDGNGKADILDYAAVTGNDYYIRMKPTFNGGRIYGERKNDTVEPQKTCWFGNGAGSIIASLAMAKRLHMTSSRRHSPDDALRHAQEAWRYVTANDKSTTTQTHVQKVIAGTEMWRTTGDPEYLAAADASIDVLLRRVRRDEHFSGWISTEDPRTPYFNSATSDGDFMLALIRYCRAKPADADRIAKVKDMLTHFMAFQKELAESMPNNLFGLSPYYAGKGEKRYFLAGGYYGGAHGLNPRYECIALAALLYDDYFQVDTYKDLAAKQLDWVFGGNVDLLCFMSPIGSRFFEQSNINGVTALGFIGAKEGGKILDKPFFNTGTDGAEFTHWTIQPAMVALAQMLKDEQTTTRQAPAEGIHLQTRGAYPVSESPDRNSGVYRLGMTRSRSGVGGLWLHAPNEGFMILHAAAAKTMTFSYKAALPSTLTLVVQGAEKDSFTLPASADWTTFALPCAIPDDSRVQIRVKPGNASDCEIRGLTLE
jgi:hypothetical protein